MIINRRNIKDNVLGTVETKKAVFKNIEHQLFNDYLVTIKEEYENNKVLTPVAATTNHNFSFIEPKHITEIENKETLGSIPSYHIQPTFEYLALEWEANFNTVNELQSPLLYSEADGEYSEKVLNFSTIKKDRIQNLNVASNPIRLRTQEELNKHANILFGVNYNYKMKNYLKKNYPFHIDISININTENKFKSKLKELGLYELLIIDYTQATKPFSTFGDEVLRTFDFSEWISSSNVEIDESNTKILSPSYTTPNDFFYNLKKLNIIGFARQMVKSKQRKIIDILNGEDCYNEIMFYRFEKYENSTNRLIQTFWLPAEDAVSFVDTQVKYGTTYRYNCFAHTLVIGAKYEITEMEEKMQSVIDPSIKIIEIPLFNETCNVVQPPQPPPEATFINNKHSKNQFDVLLKLNANYYNDVFKPLQDTELSQDEVISEYNKLKNRSYFKYEKEHALFEVFRMEELPSNLTEIASFKIGEVKHPIPSTSTILKQKISVGKKYYYVFRSVNSHGMLSNTTPIYEVEIKQDANESFLEVNTVEIKPVEKYQPSRFMTKDIQILPSALHTIFDQSQAPLALGSLKGKIDTLNLGIAEDPVWGKKFKFRITSTDTGKKIDINVNVVLTKNKTIEDFK